MDLKIGLMRHAVHLQRDAQWPRDAGSDGPVETIFAFVRKSPPPALVIGCGFLRDESGQRRGSVQSRRSQYEKRSLS